MHIAGFAADVGFIDLNLANHLVEAARLHGEANTVQHVPRGLLRDAERAGEFIRRHTILAVRQHPDRDEPLIETKRAVFKDGADLGAELALRVLLFAFPKTARRNEANVSAAMCSLHAFLC